MEISDSLKKYADVENPIIATATTMIGNIFPITKSNECSINFLYTESFTLKKISESIMSKRKAGKHARFADQKAARRKANKKS